MPKTEKLLNTAAALVKQTVLLTDDRSGGIAAAVVIQWRGKSCSRST